MKKQIFGETDGIRAKAGEKPLQPNILKALARAIAQELQANKCLIARDTRESGLWIVEALKEGLIEENVDIEDVGVLPTPAVQAIMAADTADYTCGIMVTASHNPAEDNGVKLFVAGGEKADDALELAIEQRFFADFDGDNDVFGAGNDGKNGVMDDENGENANANDAQNAILEAQNAKFAEMGTNAEMVEKYIKRALETLRRAKNAGGTGKNEKAQRDDANDGTKGEDVPKGKILLDAAAGAGHGFSKLVFEDFGYEVESIDPDPNGKNINDGFGALHPEKLALHCKANGVMGIALDGDADRCILVDEEGRIWNGDRIVSMLALYLKEKGELANNAVVLTEYSNLSAIKYLESKDIRVEKVVVGDRAVAEKCAEIGAILGGENAGHIIYCPWLTSSDGTFMTLLTQQILAEKNCRLADLYPDYEEFPNVQLGIKVREKKPLETLPEWKRAVELAEKAMAQRGRIFTRYSGTEMKLRILVEGPEMRENQSIAESLADIVRKEIGA